MLQLTPPSSPESRSSSSSPTVDQRGDVDDAACLSEVVPLQENGNRSPKENSSYKRAADPPQNDDRKIICEHLECAGITFHRKYEWNKHMDKHNRPYKCLIRECETRQGFTYSGGLLRHEREVHKMHGWAKKSVLCPFTDCKRSSGDGFTRKENRTEHIRRVHRNITISADIRGLMIRPASQIVNSRQASETPDDCSTEDGNISKPSLKRKRNSDSVLPDSADEDLRAIIKKLRHESTEQDARLQQLEGAVAGLQQRRR